MLVSVSFVVVMAVLLAGIGRTVELPVADPDVEPEFARHVARGIVVLWLVGRARAEHLDAVAEALSGRDDEGAPPQR